MADQFYQYGKLYLDESSSILQRMPKLPSKFEGGQKDEGQRVSAEVLKG